MAEGRRASIAAERGRASARPDAVGHGSDLRRAGGGSARPRPERPASRARARLDVDERRAQLVALGIELFGQRPYDEVSIDELAEAAGISKGLLYHYFPTKRDFYVASVREAARQLLATTDTDPALPAEERLRAGLDAYLAYVERHAAAYTTVMRSGVGTDPELSRVVDGTREELLQRIVEGAAQHGAAPLARAALRGFVGFVEAASLEWVQHRAVSRDELRDLFAGVLVATLGLASRT